MRIIGLSREKVFAARSGAPGSARRSDRPARLAASPSFNDQRHGISLRKREDGRAPAPRPQSGGGTWPRSEPGASRRASCPRSTSRALLPCAASESRCDRLCGNSPSSMPARNTTGKLQALGVVNGQQAHLRLFVQVVGVRHQRRMIQKIADGFAPLGGFGGRVDQLLDVLPAGLGLGRAVRTPASCGSRCDLDESHERPVSGLSRPPARSPASGCGTDQRRLRAGGKQILVDHADDGVPQAQIVARARMLHLLDGGAADAARRRVDDAQQADRIGGLTAPVSNTRRCP